MGSSLFSPDMIAAVDKATGMVKRRGGVISFDPNIRPELLRTAGLRQALRSILEQTDVFLPSGDEATLLVDTNQQHVSQVLQQIKFPGFSRMEAQ